ncbi:MAG: response regulator [Desulfobacterota bacterium]|nr:response regulator [Thermodesulfobacteriota bacterium]
MATPITYDGSSSPVLHRCVPDIVEKLQHCEQQGCLLSDNIGDVLYTLDTDLTITSVSRSVIRMLGYTPEEIKALSLDRLFNPASYRMLAAQLRKLIRSHPDLEHPRLLTLESVAKDGSLLWVEIRITQIIGEDGAIVGLLGVMRDITQQRKTEVEKQRLEKRLLKMQRLETVGTLAGGIAHDFNNILTTINGYCELLLKDITEGQQWYEELHQIQNAAARGEALVRQLLSFSRRQQAQLKPLNVNHIVQDMLKLLDRLIGEDILIITECSPDVWTVRADAGRIEQILMNFTVNARDAMQDGGTIIIRTDNVVISAEEAARLPDGRAGAFVRLSVVDSGKGIDEKYRDKMFEPFFTTKREGAGLGLATVKSIAEQHKGWVAAENRPEGGAVFSLYLPAVNEADIQEEQHGRSTAVPCCSGNHEHILLVEDDDAIRDVIMRALMREGYEVTAAASAEQALAVFEEHSEAFDLLFSDVVLSGKSGLELAIALQERRPDLRILLASGYADDKAQWPEIKRRGYRFLRKPFLMADLLQHIRHALDF